MSEYDQEEQGLIQFIMERPKGNLLREIAETRLKEIVTEASRFSDGSFIRKTAHNSVAVKNMETGRVFPSIASAALSINLEKSLLWDDLIRTNHKYPFRKLLEVL